MKHSSIIISEKEEIVKVRNAPGKRRDGERGSLHAGARIFQEKGKENPFTFRDGCVIMLSGLICDPYQIDKK